MTDFKQESSNRCFGGRQLVISHQSTTVNCRMRFGLFLPSASESGSVPVLYYLSGLTCTEQNVITKAGAQRYCEQHGLALVCPDTSPRGEGVPDDSGADDLGTGAGFYVNATQPPWSSHYQMYDYVTRELPAVVEANFSVSAVRGITGHSMGGHGALVIGLREPERFLSVSAFSPICSPSDAPWGKKALSAYLGADTAAWANYDAGQLVRSVTGPRHPLLVDVGTGDPFLTSQLMPERLESACKQTGHPLELRRQEGYDHSYYFISSFIGDHVRHHAELLANAPRT